jgi:hypothetical protein
LWLEFNVQLQLSGMGHGSSPKATAQDELRAGAVEVAHRLYSATKQVSEQRKWLAGYFAAKRQFRKMVKEVNN